MKKFVYIIMSGDKIVAIYESKDIAEKLMCPIGEKLNLDNLEIVKKQINPDIKIV